MKTAELLHYPHPTQRHTHTEPNAAPRSGVGARARPVAAPGRVLASVSQHDAARSRRHAAEPLRASALAALRPCAGARPGLALRAISSDSATGITTESLDDEDIDQVLGKVDAMYGASPELDADVDDLFADDDGEEEDDAEDYEEDEDDREAPAAVDKRQTNPLQSS